MEYLLGIDIGTTGTKAIGLQLGGTIWETAYAAYPTMIPRPDEQELDPDLLENAVIRVIREVTGRGNGSASLLGVCFSCAMHSIMAVDASGSPLTPAITWADLRSRAYASRLKESDLGRRLYARTGTPMHPMSPLCKIMWLRENEPGIFSRAAKFISIKEFIWYRFFGHYQVDYSLDSATGLFDIHDLRWCAEALETAGIDESRLSELVPPTHMERNLAEALKRQLALPAGVPFIIGASDGCLANLGSGATGPADLALTIGTSGAVRRNLDHPTPDPAQRVFNFLLTENRYVLGGAINNGGNVVSWWVDQFMPGKAKGIEEIAAPVAEAATLAGGSQGLIFLPYLHGERAPIWDPEVRGVFFGVRATQGPLHFLRSLLEGIGFSLYQISIVLEDLAGPADSITASGGFIRSAPWLQMLADIFLKEVRVTSEADASGTGAAWLGFFALGLLANLEPPASARSILRRYLPDAARHAEYQQRFEIFASLYDRLKPEFPRLDFDRHQ